MGDLPLNIADIGIGLVLFFSALLAYMRGFVHETFSVIAWIGAIFATLYGFPYLRPYAHSLIPHEVAADVTAAVFIFVFSLGILAVISRAISVRIQDSALNALDRSLGFLFGLARGAVIVCLAYIGVEWMMPPAEQPHWIRQARSIHLVEAGADFLRSLVPGDAAAAGAGAIGASDETARKLMDGQRVLEQMLTPQPKGTPPGVPSATPPGYGAYERQQMERLIDGARQRYGQ